MGPGLEGYPEWSLELLAHPSWGSLKGAGQPLSLPLPAHLVLSPAHSCELTRIIDSERRGGFFLQELKVHRL